ncbi:putative oxoacyl carrier protein reductase, Short-chain dehydrogenase/reductase SDR (plasmid) [Cupriavidus taiwanensis]|uniref:Putative oxoacyl carrier protein reductase, Short-chain dehydrogenase/reductase SDR n=1 Tax=Cupriavidus taiwanensis TaxID=164546 RepID=A0A375IHX2_9BURK|nr:SDR family NAD(P)-dependent oxidoreductase [Cupriavidus taiwanensis]SPK74373.1 putative oxoacyl carrier protein reductase, Short-chain dehydrogenase/reductase SDR [Cupriavidus taiwanensis]
MSTHPFDLTGKVALVTGGNGGIGLGIAEGLAAAGADIAIWGTNAGKNAAAADRLGRHGHKVHTELCDVGDEQAVDAAMARTVAALGRIDGCFANAGVGSGSKAAFDQLATEAWRRTLRVNLDGAFFTLRAAVRQMLAQGEGGVLCSTASVAAIEGAPRAEHYAATKGGVISMMRGLAVEYARKGIRAHSILPGWIKTEMTSAAQGNDAFQDMVHKRVPMRRWGEGSDFAGIAVYLMSPASAYHTGDTFVIDGGYTLF